MNNEEKITKAQSCGKAGCTCGRAAHGGGYFTHCPNHDDGDDPKLLVREDENHTVSLTCFGPCGPNNEKVKEALRKKGLWEDVPSSGKGQGGTKADTTYTPTDAGNSTEAIKAISVSTKKGAEVQKMEEKQVKAESNTNDKETGKVKPADAPAKGQGQPKPASKDYYGSKKLTVEQWKKEDGVELKTNPAFENLFGDFKALSDESLKSLTHSLLHDADGCRDPIRVWRGYTVDGHNRLGICLEHNLPFKIEEIEAETELDVMIWMFRNQLGRRNLSKEQRAVLVVSMEESIAAKAKLNQKQSGAGKKGSPMLVNPIDTQKVLAKEAGVSHGTMYKVQQLKKKAPEKLKEVCQGKKSINKAYKEVKPEAKAKKVASGKPKTVSQNKTSVAKIIKDLKPEVKSEPVHAVQETAPSSTAEPPRCSFCGDRLICRRCAEKEAESWPWNSGEEAYVD